MKKSNCLLLLFVFVSACSGILKSNPSPTLEPEVSTLPATEVVPMTSMPAVTSTEPPPLSPTGPVTFTTADGITLAGTLFGEGDIAVILAHQGTFGADQTTWQPFARLLAERGYAALTFDFRGVGQSEGELDYGNLALDVNAAVQFLQDRGYQQIICIGASMGGTACIRAAQDQAFTGLIILASTMTAGIGGDALRLTPDDLANLLQPKLIITADLDSSMVGSDTKRMYELAPDPKALLLFPGTQHGTDLFSTEVGEELSAAMLRFLEYLENPDSAPALQPITLENAEKLQLLRTMNIPDYHKGQISQCSLAFSPDGHLLVGACGKNPVPIWDVQSGFLLRTLYPSPEQIVACDFRPDGKVIACGGFDRAVTLWDAATGEKAGSFERDAAPIWDLAFNPGGIALATCSLGLFGGGPGQGDVRLWNTVTSRITWSDTGTSDYLSLAFDPTGKTLVYGSIGGRVGILDATTGELVRELTNSFQNIGDVTFSPTGLWLAAGSDDDRIYLWDTSTYELSAQLTGHAGYVNGVAFNPDETLLASGSHDTTVGVWSVTEQKLITRLSGHTQEVLRVAFSPDGTLIASISWDGTVRLWGVDQE